MSFKPSPYQQAFFDWVKEGSGHAIVEAVAGSGKTTTAVKGMGLIAPNLSILFLAFNKSIAEELSAKAPAHASVMTLNSLGHRSWGRLVGGVQLNADKTRAIMAEQMSDSELRLYGAAVKKLVGLAKAHGIVPKDVKGARGLCEDTDSQWHWLMENYDVEIEPPPPPPPPPPLPSLLPVEPVAEPKTLFGADQTDEEWERQLAVERYVMTLCRNVLSESCQRRKEIDFDDQIYMSVIFGASPSKYDWVFVDEAQDLSPVQQRLVCMACKPKGGRIVAIGDSRQAIYAWRGADSLSMKNFGDQLKATRLELSICYRCPRSHIELAQEYVPQIKAADTAIMGTVFDYGGQWKPEDFSNNDLIICRYTAPMVRMAYALLSQKVAVRILGRDLGSGLTTLIKKLKPRSRENLIEKAGIWAAKERAKLLKKDPDANLDPVDDKYDTLMTFIEMFPGKGPDGICCEIENLYSDNTKGILTLSTVHKAKGMEADRVFILNRELMPSKNAKKLWQKLGEENLLYVALTRAKKHLGFINIKGRN